MDQHRNRDRVSETKFFGETKIQKINLWKKILKPNTIIIGKFAQSQDILNSQDTQNHHVHEAQFVMYDILCEDCHCDVNQLGCDITERCQNHLQKIVEALNKLCRIQFDNDNNGFPTFSFDCINCHNIKEIPDLLSSIQKFDGSGIYDRQRPPQWQHSNMAETKLYNDELAVRGSIKYVLKNISSHCIDSKNNDKGNNDESNTNISNGVDNDQECNYH